MTFPDQSAAIPPAVARLAGERATTAVWENELGGRTYRVGADVYVKWMPVGTPELDFDAEMRRLRWAARFVTVPRVIDRGRSGSDEWLVTAALPGTSAVDPRWSGHPDVAAHAIGTGLRHLHEKLPVEDCPFDWSIESRTRSLDACALKALGDAPSIDRLVVCHGDACAPNTLLGDDGAFTAHVDLGSLGVADRWADLAVAAWSLDWNFDDPREDLLFEAYGVEPDERRLEYYRRL